MNTNPGIIGKKLGSTQVFEGNGEVKRVTVVDLSHTVVLGRRTLEKDGYSALIVGFGKKREKNVNKPEAGFFKKINQSPVAEIRELRLSPEDVAKFEVGATIKPTEIFTEGQFVDVCGQTRGRGFTGVMARWNFRGSATKTHGTHEYQRHGGAIGTNMTPGRTLPNLKMPGQYGNEKVTIQNLKVIKLMDAEGLVLIEGGIPGSRNTVVTVRAAVKKRKPS